MEISVAQMMQIEEKGHSMGFLKKFMMENAGASAVRRLQEAFDVSEKNVLIIAGTGNNGGDGMVMARHLAGLGASVRISLLGDADSLRTDEAKWNWDLLTKMNSLEIIKSYDDAGATPDILVDAVLGTGISGNVRQPHASAISFINKSDGFKLAVDVPSGLDATTGTAAGECVRADMTVTFHRAKSGMASRNDVCGKIFVEPIGIPPEAEVGIL